MNSLALLETQSCTRFALGMLYFLCLGCLPAALLAIAFRILPERAITSRYQSSLIALAAMMITFLASLGIADWQLSLGDTATKTNDLATNQLAVASVASVPSSNAKIVYPDGIPATDRKGTSIQANAPITLAASTSVESTRYGNWTTYVTISYLLGVIGFGLRLVSGLGFSRRLRTRATPVNQPEVQSLISRLAKRVQLRETPVVMWCERVAVPTVIGVLRPAVLLPMAMSTGVPITQIEHVLIHEFTHLRRRDSLVHFLQNIIETLLFFHPLVWWVSGQVRLHRELACDAAVVASGVDSKQYVRTLLDVATSSRRGHLAGVASVSSRSQLRRRIDRLLGQATSSRGSSRQIVDSASLVVVLVILTTLLLVSQSLSVAAPQVESGQGLKQHQKPTNIEPTELAGIVVDVDGNPLSGVTVDAWSWNPGDETITDDNGVFRFKPDSENGRRKVEVRWMKDGYSPHYVAQQSVGVKDLVITLDKSTFIEGAVTAIDGSPAVGVQIRGLQQRIQADGVLVSEVPTQTTTDAAGKYRLYVYPDNYSIKIASDFGVSRIDDVRLNHAETLLKDIQLSPGVRFEAIVNDATTGEPFAGLVLSNFMEQQVKGKSNSDGTIVITGMLPGEFEFDVGAGEPKKSRGMTYYANGPLGRWWSADALRPWQQLKQEAKAFQRNFDSLTFDLQPDMKPVKIFVEAGVEFSGHVFDPTGKPRGGATVAPARTGSGNSLTGDTRYSVKTEDDGSYKVVMPAGNEFQYNLMAFDGEYQKWRKFGSVARQPLATKPGQKVTDYDFTLTHGATVRGQVVLPAGEKAPPRQVRAHPADLRGNRYFDPTVEVQSDGSFELGGLRPGKHFIQVSPFWYSSGDARDRTSVTVDVKDGESREGIVLEIPSESDQVTTGASKIKQDVDLPANLPFIGADAGGVIFEAEDKIFSVPCFNADSMFFGACDGNFYCLDKSTGTLRWKVSDLGRLDSNPVIHDDVVYFANFAGVAFALRVGSGELIWKRKLEGCYGSPMIHDNLVWLASNAGISGLDLSTGIVTESYEFGSIKPIWMECQVVAQGNRLLVFVTSDYESDDYLGKGSLVCFERGNQTPAWTTALGGCSFGQLVADSQHVYVGTRDGSFNAVRLTDGHIQWKSDCRDVFADPNKVWPDGDAIDNGDSIVIIAGHQSLDDPGALVCIEKSSGKRLWSIVNQLQFARHTGQTINTLVTTTLDYKLLQLDRASGKVLSAGTFFDSQNHGQGETYNVSVDNGFAFITGADNKVRRFDLSKLQ